jgi:hypothetical protein
MGTCYGVYGFLLGCLGVGKGRAKQVVRYLYPQLSDLDIVVRFTCGG